MRTLIFVFLSICTLTGIHAQDVNRVIRDETIDKDILYGMCNVEGLKGEVFGEAFQSEYLSYEPQSDALLRLRLVPEIDELEVIIVFGTWCGDSKREVPRFVKLAEQIGIQEPQIKMYATNREKKCGEAIIDSLLTELVPTFYIYRGGKLIGSIVEFPVNSLEEDLLAILLKEE